MFLVLAFAISVLFFVHGASQPAQTGDFQSQQPVQQHPLPGVPVPPQQQPPPELQTPVPTFSTYQPVKEADSSLGKVLSDIESHMPAGHIYRDSDRITWAHETSHGLASKLRSHFREQSSRRINAFYVLDDNVVVMEEPKTTMQAAAKYVSPQLRGMSYNLYMVQQARSWGDTPLYICDEWIAYTNGSATRIDLKIQSRGETVTQMLEFTVYSLCMAMSNPERLDPQFKSFMAWHIKRVMDLYNANLSIGDTSKATAYLNKIRTADDEHARNMRSFAKEYLGERWTREILGF